MVRFRIRVEKNYKNPFILDSFVRRFLLEEYAYNELRYRVLKQTQPQDAEHLMKLAQEIVDLNGKPTKIWWLLLGAENFQPTFKKLKVKLKTSLEFGGFCYFSFCFFQK